MIDEVDCVDGRNGVVGAESFVVFEIRILTVDNMTLADGDR